jgi:hypothetical protein
MMECYKELIKKEMSYRQQKQGKLTVLVTSCLGIVFPKHNIEGNIEGRIEVTGRRDRRRKHLLAGLKKRR